MAELIEDDKPLPAFRKDLEIFEGPNEVDGSPTFNLYDPVKAKYYKITWGESLIFRYLKPGMTPNQLYELIASQTTLKVTKEEVKFFFMDAFRHDLLAVIKSPDYYSRLHDKKNINLFMWIIYNYLYIRIPLINPNSFLEKTVKYVRFLGSPPALTIFFITGFIGIVFLFTRFGEFINTFTYFFTPEGIVIYALAISCVKIIHEFSHAYTAKNYGVYVPSMGIALIVLWPVLYTDVTDGWKLKNRNQRLRISAAGIIAELIIAGLCTIGWYYSDKGVAQSVFFVIASVTWISTLIINLNPAVRFDGYYILGDIWGVDNLQQRAFNLTRWKLREWLLGINVPCPEERLTTNRLVGMMAYTIYTWIYRVFLYTAIALFVYYKFTKALGVFLFLLEIAIFMIWPISSEIKVIAGMKQHLTANPRMMVTLTIALALLGWFVLPLPHQVKFSAITAPIEQQLIYVPANAVVKKIHIERGQDIKKGEPIIELDSPQLNHEIGKLDFEKQILEKQIYLISFSDPDRSYLPEKKAELASNNEKLLGLQNKQKEFDIRSQLDGKIYLWDDKLFEGMNLAQDTVLGKIADPQKVEVIAFIPETDATIIREGETVYFRTPSNNDLFKGKVVSVNPVRTAVLKQFPLASIFHGDLAVTEDPTTKELKMVDTYYTIKVSIEDHRDVLRFGQTGYLEVEGPWKSKFMVLMKNILRIFWRESGV